MSSGETRKRVRELLQLPLHHKRSRSSDPGVGSSGSQTLLPPVHCNPLQNEAFQNAIQKYIANLSEDDKAAFRSPPDIMKKLSESPISSSTRMQKVEKLLQCLKRFLASTAIGIQHHAEISSIVVGGLHCILIVSTLYLLIDLIS